MGDYATYHENGKLKEQGKYRMGLRHGVFSTFDESGKLLDEKEFKRGNPN